MLKIKIIYISLYFLVKRVGKSRLESKTNVKMKKRESNRSPVGTDNASWNDTDKWIIQHLILSYTGNS